MDLESAFDKETIRGQLEAFIPGLAPHITAIKYEALSPDEFCFLFKTNGKGGKDYFFVLFSTDNPGSLEQLQKAIEHWHGGNIVTFIKTALPQATETANNADTEQYLCYPFSNSYASVLAEVQPPKAPGYWATEMTFRPGDDITAKISHMPELDQQAILRQLSPTNIQRRDNTSYLSESYGYNISVFKNNSGKWEYFMYPLALAPQPQ